MKGIRAALCVLFQRAESSHLQNLLYAGKVLVLAARYTGAEGGLSCVTRVQDRIRNQGCFPDSKSKLLVYYITCSQTFPATKS